MSIQERINLIFYRLKEKGLEVFLVKISENDLDSCQFRSNQAFSQSDSFEVIELESTLQEKGIQEKTVAIEGDWNDIPSLKALLHNDLQTISAKVKEVVPHLEHGRFVAIKEAIKKVLPKEYALLKELKDIIKERHSIRDM